MREKAAKFKEKLWKTFRNPGELLLSSTLKMTTKPGSLEAKYKETSRGSRLLHLLYVGEIHFFFLKCYGHMMWSFKGRFSTPAGLCAGSKEAFVLVLC